ncbi:MAG: hypothetical protein M1830_005569 [Pleopsidium flavum]|nr:MAG: hypothetical protein M1830_005569 [Pleopsidium flavum]
MRLHEYLWSLGAFTSGTFGQVTAGTGSDGKAVAVKRFKEPEEEKLSAHRKMMSYIGKHQKLAFTTQVTLFCQYLDGLSFLHEVKGIMHRDIKPNNLGVVDLVCPRAVIFDLDSATRDETSRDHFQGSLSYLAPEIVALKNWNGDKKALPPPYGRKVDVWALGVSAYVTDTDTDECLPKECMTDNLYQSIQQRLKLRIKKDCLKAPFLKIVLQMLAWSAHERPSATEALEELKIIDQDQSGKARIDTEGSRKKRQQRDSSSSGRRVERRR